MNRKPITIKIVKKKKTKVQSHFHMRVAGSFLYSDFTFLKSQTSNIECRFLFFNSLYERWKILFFPGSWIPIWFNTICLSSHMQ